VRLLHNIGNMQNYSRTYAELTEYITKDLGDTEDIYIDKASTLYVHLKDLMSRV